MSGPARYRRRVLKLVLPKGSLEKATLELFAAADLPQPDKPVVRKRMRNPP